MAAQPGEAAPTVSIGLPVYNGERFLAETFEALLAQDFTDFEIIVCDNASTDGTPAIAAEYARRDPRVRYVRNDRNLGSSPNYIRAFQLARGKYFAWAAYDDLRAPGWLGRCVELLDRDPGAVGVQTGWADIDESGKVIRRWEENLPGASTNRYLRVREFAARDHECIHGMGLLRSDVLARTGLIAPYSDSDRVLLVELAMRGRLEDVPEELFFRREHSERSMRKYPDPRDRAAFFDTRLEGRITLPVWRIGVELVAAVHRSELPWPARVRCYWELRLWLAHNWSRLLRNLARAGLLSASRRDIRPARRSRSRRGVDIAAAGEVSAD